MTPLVEPVGRKLAKARETRGLTLEEAALETRIRATQLAALEADDYSAFPNNTYARGFLLIYGKFLGVDVREMARSLEGSNPISISEYQYLNAYPETEPQRAAPQRREEPRSRRPSLVPLIVFVLLLGAGALGVHLYLQAQRLESGATETTATNVEAITPRNTEPTPTASATPAPSKTTAIVPARPTPPPLATSPNGDADRAFLSAKPTPVAAQPMAAQPVAAQPVAAPTPTLAPVAAAPLPPVNELIVEPLKKTRVTIRRDDPNAEPIFDDVLYPKVGALKLKGARFFLQISEPDAVTLRKNGQSVAYQPGTFTVP